jgi:hypothetical protein
LSTTSHRQVPSIWVLKAFVLEFSTLQTIVTASPRFNMAHKQGAAPSIVDSDAWDICTPATSEKTAENTRTSETPQSSIPWPGRTFIIRNQANGKVITFLNGEIILDKPGGLGTFRWRCVEKFGWLGFKDPASAQHLGYDEESRLRCAVDHHQDWEYICPRMRPDGGFVLMVLVEQQLLPLGAIAEESKNGTKQKVKIMDWLSEGVVWDFIEVQN